MLLCCNFAIKKAKINKNVLNKKVFAASTLVTSKAIYTLQFLLLEKINKYPQQKAPAAGIYALALQFLLAKKQKQIYATSLICLNLQLLRLQSKK